MKALRLSLVVAAALTGIVAQAQQGGNISPQSRAALIAVLDEERLAKHAYEVVLTKFPALMPFVNLVEAEAKHEQAVIRVMTSYRIPIPENRWGVTSFVPTPPTVDDAYLLGVRIETEDIQMLTQYLRTVREPNVRQLFTHLKSASQSHLAAIRRVMSGGCTGDGTGNQARNGQGGSGRGRGNGQGGNGGGNCDGTGPHGNGQGGPRRP